MKQQNKNIYFLLFALFTVICLVLAGIAVAKRSALGFFLALLASVAIMGLGFTFKRKWRKENE